MLQIFVLIVPGSTIDTWMPNGRSSTRSESATASSACFEAAYGPRKGSALRPAIEPTKTIRPWRDGMRAGSACVTAICPTTIDLELVAQLLRRHELERRGKGDPSVVDETVKFFDAAGRVLDLLRFGDVEQHLLGSLRGIAFPTDAGEDSPARAHERDGARLPDAGRGARHECGAHQSSSQAAIFARWIRAWPP